ncbi:hypothetical protein [Gemmobacter nectariphilus]|uniref:hypothetical protein n=1 Tax=Gemmobacter nectariphilus TaxID=220343 RepID=UPI0004839298|nr:hypothetical protein [Gemmobacter nectariphilus]
MIEAFTDPEHARQIDKARTSDGSLDPDDARIDGIVGRCGQRAGKRALSPGKPKTTQDHIPSSATVCGLRRMVTLEPLPSMTNPASRLGFRDD